MQYKYQTPCPTANTINMHEIIENIDSKGHQVQLPADLETVNAPLYQTKWCKTSSISENTAIREMYGQEKFNTTIPTIKGPTMWTTSKSKTFGKTTAGNVQHCF